MVSWPVPVVTVHPMRGLCGHRAVDLGPGAVEHGGGQLCVLGGREPRHGVGAMILPLSVRHRPRVSMVSSVSLVSLRVHIHDEAAGLGSGGRLRARMNVGV